MTKILANPKLYGAVTLLFTIATLINSGNAPSGMSGSLLDPVGIEMKSGPTMPPDPYDEKPPEGDNKRQFASLR